jgi:glycosyltransferase involved in cell wall biosynthesis
VQDPASGSASAAAVPATPSAPRHVLVVARWYPAHDDPGRGSFVADHVRALLDAGIAVTVASFDPAILRGEADARPALGRTAAVRWRAVVPGPDTTNVAGPAGPAVPGVPVARLPVVLEPGERPIQVEVDAHADPLLAFGLALAAREPFDLVHAHTSIPDGLSATRLAEALALPLVVTEHASLIREQLDDADAVTRVRGLTGPGRRLVAVSDHLARFMDERLGVAPGTVGVLSNVVPEALFPDVAAGTGPVAGAGPAAGGPLLLWVGARKASKGTDTLIRAFAIARGARPDLRLRLVGRAPTDDEEARLRALVVEAGCADVVAFDPPVPREAVAGAMRRATLFVHPSPFETFGMVAAEALLVGLPVVATPSGVEAIVGADGTCGEIAASTGADDLAAAILRALDRRTAYDPTAMRARVLARSNEAAVRDATLALYAAAAADPTAAAAAGAPAAADGTGVSAGGAPIAAIPPSARPLVVCLNRTVALRALTRLPASVRSRMVVLTGPPTRQAPDPAPSGETWLEHDPAGEYRTRMAELTTQAGTSGVGRLRALASSGSRHRERDAMAADRDGWIAAAAVRSLEAARAAGTAPDGPPPFLVAVEAADVAAALPLLDAGVPLAPGGLRWLVDREGVLPGTESPWAT